MRITISLILNLLANGMTSEQVLDAYPYLEPEDIQAALTYAAWLADESVYTVESMPGMKFLGDKGISPQSIAFRRDQHIEAVHRYELGLVGCQT